MQVRIDRAFATTSHEEIAQFENRRGVILPDEYKRFLLMYNGGRPKPNAFDVPEWPHENSGLQRFFGIHPGKDYDLEHEWEGYADRVPGELMPIACDSFGNLICLGIKGGRRGKIYFWDHEDELDENGRSRQDYGNVYLVANSLGEFLDKLKELED
jgi:hypothetical protein